jgi:hypothetical protein
MLRESKISKKRGDGPDADGVYDFNKMMSGEEINREGGRVEGDL